MALTQKLLSNGGSTTHYNFWYDDSLSAPLNPGGPEPARTNSIIAATKSVIAACENDFNLMSAWFRNIALDVNFPISVNVTQNSGGAAWGLRGGNLTVNIGGNLTANTTGAASFVRYLLVSEMVEQFMRAQGLHWYGSGTEGSEGEGLSRFLAAQFLALNGFGNPPASFANSNLWLSSSRADNVNNINPKDDGPDAITGCSLLFLYYLFTQLNFSIGSIVAAGAPTLAGVYKNLTGDSSDPFPFFKQLLDGAYPGTSTITGPNLGNPFPLSTVLPIWIGDFTQSGRAEVLFYAQGVGSWSLGTQENGQLAWSLISQTRDPNGINFGNTLDFPTWIGDFTGSGHAEVLFYSPFDGHWWLGSYANGQLAWSLISQTRNPNGINFSDTSKDPTWIGDFTGSGHAEVLFYSPFDGHWWLGSYANGQLAWSLISQTRNTNGINFGDTSKDPAWIGDFTGSGHAEVLFYSPVDQNWWSGVAFGNSTNWSFEGTFGI